MGSVRALTNHANQLVRWLADMNLSPLTVDTLRDHGWDITRVSDRLPPGAPDVEVLAFAREEGFILVTHDLDFSMHVALSGQRQPSLVTLRLALNQPIAVAQRLLDVLPQIESSLASGSAVSIDDVSVRVRSLPVE